MELVGFGDSWFVISKGTGDHDLVDDDTVVVDFAEAVCCFQVVETDFVVERNVVALSLACNSNNDVLDSTVAMDEAYIVVE